VLVVRSPQAQGNPMTGTTSRERAGVGSGSS
jgi:hypothetical protein